MIGPPAAAAPKPAATILLVRDSPAFEVLMVRRHHEIDFAAGALVFPGGKTHAGDHDGAWERHVIGWNRVGPHERALRIAAIREAYEEAGVLLARGEDGATFSGDPRAEAARQDIAADRRPLLDLVADLQIRLDLDALNLFARWITPVIMPKRFDTWFYIANNPPEQMATCDGRETVGAEWIAPTDALRLGAAGARKIIFPTRLNLQLLGEAADAAAAIADARGRPLVVVEPRVVDRPAGPTLIIPPDAGYGEVSELLARAT